MLVLVVAICLFYGQRPGCRPGGRVPFFRVAERKEPKKGRPCCLRPLRCATGQPGVLGHGVHRRTHCAPAALRSNNCGESVHEARVSFGTRATPRPARPRRIQKGTRESDIHTGHRCARPRLRSAWRLRPQDEAERSKGPWGCSAVHPLLAAPAAGRLWGGMGVEAPMLRELTRRSCPNGAAKQRSEFCGAPRNRPAAGLPRSKAQGSQTGGRLSFGYFSLAKQRTSTSAAGPRPGFRTKTKHAQTSIGSAQTAGGNSKTTKNNGCQHLIDRRQQPK